MNKEETFLSQIQNMSDVELIKEEDYTYQELEEAGARDEDSDEETDAVAKINMIRVEQQRRYRRFVKAWFGV